MPLDIKESIKWSLVISSIGTRDNRVLSFQQPLFSSEEDYGENGMKLLDYLQDVFYVKQMEYVLNDGRLLDKDTIDQRDDAWEVLNEGFGDVFAKIHTQKQLLVSDHSYNNSDELFRLKGEAYGNYIRSVMKDVYPLRYEFYTAVKQLIPMSVRKRNNLERCTDIICDGHAFQHFFNLSLEWLEKTQLNLQTYENDDLEKLLTYLSRREGFSQFRNKYIKRGCFSKTLVFDGTTYTDLLCFSGSKKPTGQLETSIKRIANCGLFQNCQLIILPYETRYMLSETKYITLGDAIISSLYDEKQHGRMFSCCERKTFAGYNWSSCKVFRMIVKYQPCELCEDIVKYYKKKYNGEVIYGKKLPPLQNRKTFDDIANAIHHKLYPLLLPLHPNPSNITPI